LKDTLQINPSRLKRSQSFGSLVAITRNEDLVTPLETNEHLVSSEENTCLDHGEALEMRHRSAQKTFIRVEISSIHLLLSIMKEDSFLCRNAKIRTRELVFRNQTFSFEELVGQFVPSDPSWRGWVKMALHQPLLPVLPVAREIISKTKWGSKQSARLLSGKTGNHAKFKRGPKANE